jgi:hypothetical protein
LKKPKTYKELIELINPLDIDEIIGFSGKNDKPDSEHWKLRKKYSDLMYSSIYRNFLGR